MSIIFVVENSGKIVRKVTTRHIEKIPVSNGQKLIVDPKDANIISSQTHYYDKNKQQFVEYSEQEKQAHQLQKLQHSRPALVGNETDDEIDAKINEFFKGQVDVKNWKKENRNWLRKKFYPPVEDFIEAYITERATGDSTKMDTFIQAYNAVILRFPVSIPDKDKEA